MKSFPMTMVCSPAHLLLTADQFKPTEVSWIPVETAVNNIPGQNTPADNGPAQRHIDTDRTAFPFQTHFLHIPVSGQARDQRFQG